LHQPPESTAIDDLQSGRTPWHERLILEELLLLQLGLVRRRMQASFEPGVQNLQQRLFDAYAAEVARVDQNGDGVISAVEADIDNGSDGFANNFRLFLPATQFNRFAVTREINDGLIALASPRARAPS